MASTDFTPFESFKPGTPVTGTSTAFSKYIGKLKGKRIAIFGGTSGIGYAVAEACLEHGGTVCIVGSNRGRLLEAAQKLYSSCPTDSLILTSRLATAVVDLSEPETLDKSILGFFESYSTKEGEPKWDHIIFTAGDKLSIQTIEDTTVQSFIQAQTVRLMAAMMIAKYAKKFMADSPDSSFTFTGGVNTDKPTQNWIAPCVIGGGIAAMSRGLAVDLAPIRANCVEPGAILTPLMRRDLDAEAEAKWKQMTKVGRLGRPEDIAEAYLYAMKDGFVTGSVIKSNGGALLC